MAAKPFLFKPLFYSVTLAGALMIPAAILLWWLAGQADYFGGESSGASFAPDAYLRRAAVTVFTVGLLIVSGAAAFAKKAKPGRFLLIAGCTAAPALSLFPVFDTFSAVSGSAAAVIGAGWVIFAAPFITLTVFLSTEKSENKPKAKK